MSVTMRTAGSGGQIHSFWAMNSLSMSFCMVPPTRSHATPCFSATTRYMARATDAVQLIVMDVVTSPSGMSARRRSKSSRAASQTPSCPTSPRSRSGHLARDHELLDLRGALVDLRDLRVAEVTLDLVLLDDPVAAVHLDRVGRDPHGGLGREELGHRRCRRVRLARVLQRR